LAGGVAHDLNNALAPVLMATELLRLELPASAAEGLDLIESGARRGADLVKQLLTFASGVEGQRVPVPLGPLFEEVKRMLRHSFPKNIVLRFDVPEDLPAVVGDSTQLYQVLLNLFLNARDAMPDGGELALDAGLAEVKSLSDVPAIDVPPGWYVRLRVTDTGSGIAPETLDRIFDPFFTTKPPEQGTGLGLATSLGIVRAHGGSIRAYSEAGQGATFSVFLPVAPGDPAAADPPAQLPSAVVGDGKTILVVDDEASVRDILRRVLVRMHFTVVTASDGTSAMRELKEHVVGFDAVITDLHMPGLDGISFVRLVRGRSPVTGIIVVSGLVAAPQRQQLKGLGVHTVLSKPFPHAELMTALQTVFAS
jgi:CheY-like chemotaxis protein